MNAHLPEPPARTYRPALISWNLTRRCNLKCPHCYLDAGRPRGPELSTERCLALLEEMADLGTEMVILTGGEPLLRKDIYQIAHHASSLGMWVVMGTNGVLITERVAEKMLACGVKGVGISLDSLNPETHDRFRGGPNAWKHAVRALRICRQMGLEVLIQTTVMLMNRHELNRLVAFARQEGAWSLNFYFLVRTGRGQQLNDLSAGETEEVLAELVQLQKTAGPMLVRAKCAPQYKRIAYQHGAAGLESGGCMAATQYCRIMPEGEVTPCPYMDVVAGNVREQAFREVWFHSPVFQQLRDRRQLKGRCGVCEFANLCGGCRCRAYAAAGDYLAEDPACPYQPTGTGLPESQIRWTPLAWQRLQRIPIAFIREKVRQSLETQASQQGLTTISLAFMKQSLATLNRFPAFAGPARQVGDPDGADG